MSEHENSPKILRVHCKVCKHETNHSWPLSLRRELTQSVFPVGKVFWYDVSDVFVCLGCEEVTLRRTSTFSENDHKDVSYYPPRISRQEPDWLWRVPDDIGGLLSETYAALHADSKRLALMGIRAAIECTMTRLVGDSGNFQANLKAFESKGYLSSHNRTFLETVLEAGHAAIHRGHEPTQNDLITAMDVVENLVRAVLILSGEAKRMGHTIPPRPSNRLGSVRSTSWGAPGDK